MRPGSRSFDNANATEPPSTLDLARSVGRDVWPGQPVLGPLIWPLPTRVCVGVLKTMVVLERVLAMTPDVLRVRRFSTTR